MNWICVLLTLSWLSMTNFVQYQFSSISEEEYLNVLTIYSRFRHISIWTHFSCFGIDENLKIAVKLSALNIQSRFMTRFGNITRLVDTPTYTFQGYVVDMSCNGTQLIFEQENHQILFKNNNYWLLLHNSNDSLDGYLEDEIPLESKNILQSLDMLPVSEVLFVKYWNKMPNAKWVFFDIYKIAPNYPLEIALFGWISPNEKGNPTCKNDYLEGSDKKQIFNRMNVTLNISEKFQTKQNRKNLNGLVLRCGLVIAYPERYTYLEDPKFDHVDITTKSTLPVSFLLREDLNFSCDIVQVDNYGWFINGTFTGAMGLYQQNRIDMLAHATNMRTDRLKYVEFTADIFPIGTPIIFRQPPLSAISNIFILPLSTTVWYCYATLMLVVSLIMAIQIVHPNLQSRISPFDIVTFVWGAVCQQGTHLLITTTSGRFVMLTTFLATLALFTSYAATIVALLQSPSHMIKDIDDLLASPLKIALQEAGWSRYNFMVENRSNLQRVYKQKVEPMGPNGWIYDEYVGIEKVRTELFAFLIETPSAYKVISRTYTEYEKCSLSEIHLLRLPMCTITVARNSGYKELIKQRLRRMREIGLITRIKNRWLLKKPICEGSTRGFTIVGLSEVKPIIQIFIVSIGVSIVILFAEILSVYITG